MSDLVENNSFWEDRIKNAERLGRLPLSVYCTSEKDWDYICQIHKKICDYYIKGSVIDVACGYGRMSEWFQEYVGIDSSKSFIKKARKEYPFKRFEIEDVKDTRFYDKEFDWAVCCSIKGMIIREVGDVEWLLMEKEIKRIAKNVVH